MGNQKDRNPSSVLHKPSLLEEIFNSITHGIGAVLSIIGGIVLINLALSNGSGWLIGASIIYSTSLISLYLSSTLYHAVQHPRVKPVLRKLDHVSIYLLIAGTYSFVILTLFRTPLGWTIFGFQWAMALTGILYKSIWGPKFSLLDATFYLAMGWMALIMVHRMIIVLPTGALVLVVAGGLCYSIGVLFFLTGRKIPYFHTIWHLFVLAGSACHYFMGVHYIIPQIA